MKVEILPVWKQLTPALGEELMAFWGSNKAIVDDTTAAARATQVVCIVRDEGGTLCGVSTSVIKVLPRLRQPMYYFRQYFAKSLRGKNQFIPVYRKTKQVLQDYNGSLESPESLGLLIETENAKLNTAYPHAHEPAFDATFIGYSPRGAHLYVSYFDSAILQQPAPMRTPVQVSPSTKPLGRQAIIQVTPGRTSGRT